MIAATTLKLGWLFPYSGIFCHLKNDLRQGFELALQKEAAGIRLEAYSEFIQSGGLKDTEDALKRLLLHEEVDLVIGVISSKVALSLIPLLESRQTPLILLNLGADIPLRQLSSDYLFYNSLHLWKSEWVIGKWAQKKYGGEPSINMSIYEGGYGLHESFKTGTAVSGAETVKLNIVRNFSANPDTGSLIQYIIDQRPQHAHALLSGKEGEQFLQFFLEHGLGDKLGLTVNPFMVEDGLLTALKPDLVLYNALTWSVGLDNVENGVFVRAYLEAYGEAPTVFSLLAYEAGLALAPTVGGQSSGKIGKKKLAENLGKAGPVGPRGEIHLSTRPLQTRMPIYIRKPISDPGTGGAVNTIVETAAGIEWDDPSLDAEPTYLSGWQNPYLCV